MTQLLHRDFDLVVRGVDRTKGTVTCTISSNRVDQHNSIILQEGMDLDQYRRNPILCWGHPLSDMCTSPGPERLLGRAIDIFRVGEGRDQRTDAVFLYARAENPLAALTFDLTAGGFLRAYSIGAKPLGKAVGKDSPKEERDMLPLWCQEDLQAGAARMVYARSMLIETSAVFAGSNFDALVAAQLGAKRMDNLLVQTEERESVSMLDRELCSRAHRVLDRTETTLGRLEAVAEKLERQAKSPEERELDDLRRQLEEDPEFLALAKSALGIK